MLKTKNSRLAARVAIVLVSALTFCLPQSGIAQAPLRFDSAWWQSAIDGEREGFVWGYVDCRPLSISQKLKLKAGDIVKAVSTILESQPNRDPNAVPKLIDQVLKTYKPSYSPPGGEASGRGPHGGLNGDFWGLTSYSEDRGYLEGYLRCAAPPVTDRSVDRLQAAIDKHYDVSGRGKNEQDAIADVLQSLLKAPGQPK